MKFIYRLLANHLYKPLLEKYLKRERIYRYHGLTVTVLPGVFHPGFFFSTEYLLQHLLKFPLTRRKLLEPGAGSGFISFVAEKNGAIVTATDISRKAIENLELNKKMVQSAITIIQSNLFENIPPAGFDYIVINPPYYPKQADDEKMLAWYCGKHFEYYEMLFAGLATYMHPETKTWMVLSEDCNLQHISGIACNHRFVLVEVSRKKIWWEWNYIFEIKQSADAVKTKPVSS